MDHRRARSDRGVARARVCRGVRVWKAHAPVTVQRVCGALVFSVVTALVLGTLLVVQLAVALGLWALPTWRASQWRDRRCP